MESEKYACLVYVYGIIVRMYKEKGGRHDYTP